MTSDKLVSVIKGLVLDTISKANSGHPGGAMSSADVATVLFSEFLNYDPENPRWTDRDRFILSAGHESALLYSLLHMQGLLPMEELKRFRQLGSLTPGHPEHDLTPGIEATTGPLGQGLGMAVGMAAAEAHLRSRLGADICDHFTYALSSDGDLQEPVALGAASLAGLWGLNRLIVFYDSNKIQLAGPTSRSDCTDYRKIFEGFCWNVVEIDGHDHAQIRQAILNAKLSAQAPTLVICHTVIAKGAATREGDFTTHGAPLPSEEIAATKAKLGMPADQEFHAPEDAISAFRGRQPALRAAAATWKARLDAKLAGNPGFAALWKELTMAPTQRTFAWPAFEAGAKVATRKAWGTCLMSLVEQMPFFVGGSADLDPSNQTEKFRQTVGTFCTETPSNRSLSFGVREFPMAAIVNGMLLHNKSDLIPTGGGLRPFGATFLTFSDYERNGVRMSALQKLPALHVFTHDSFYVGEDGPTHQPIEHTSSLRLIPNTLVLRPADARETAACLEVALTNAETPACLLLTRQSLPVLDLPYESVRTGVKRGAYVVLDCAGTPEAILIASGSEVSLAVEAAKLLSGIRIRVVSMPSMELFAAQPLEYRESVLPPCPALRVAAEAGRPELWHKYTVGGPILGIDHFGHSAPAALLAEEYGFTPQNLAKLVRERL